MVDAWVVVLIALLYFCLLFGIAGWASYRAQQGKSLIANPYVYALSLAVYCTAWTFYGSIGRAANAGLHFLPIYLGPTLMMLGAGIWLRKIIRICKSYKITSIADFLASRYDKSVLVGSIASLIALVGGVPYIALQLKAIFTSFNTITGLQFSLNAPFWSDGAFYITLILVLFTALFGARHLNNLERHEGMVATIAFESVVKLVAFLIGAVYICYVIFPNISSIFGQSLLQQKLAQLWVIQPTSYADWFWLTLLSAAAIICLPRQFHIAVVENVDEAHIEKAAWLFPLYLFLINLFVFPVAIAGKIHFAASVNPDLYLLQFPINAHQPIISLIVFIGGLSAATGMVIVATVALSTMFSNQLIMPLLLRIPKVQFAQKGNLTGMILLIRRLGILIILLCGYAYFKLIGERYALVAIGLIAFAAVAQFMPALIGALFWKNGTKKGALAGLIGGFLMWLYTLFLPSLAESEIISPRFLQEGLFGWAWLKPYALFGFDDWNSLSHSLFWSFFVNVGLFVGVSSITKQSKVEQRQARAFVDILKSDVLQTNALVSGKVDFEDVQNLLVRFLGRKKSAMLLEGKKEAYQQSYAQNAVIAQNELLRFAENQLSGVIGSASARLMTLSVTKDSGMDMEELFLAANETRQMMQANKALAAHTHTLAELTQSLTETNQRLQDLDRLKNEFVSTVTHELRTPLTAIRALSEILHRHKDISESQKQEFIGLIAQESERLSRLINDVLDLEKLESGKMHLRLETLDINEVIRAAVQSVQSLISAKEIHFVHFSAPNLPAISGDFDRLVQVLVNLLSNAIKFCPEEKGEIQVKVRKLRGNLEIVVWDNGIGIPVKEQKAVFDKFHQVSDAQRGKPTGSGLGLSIAKQIVVTHGGSIRVRSKTGKGTSFAVILPIKS